ncbi:MAG: ATP-binding protein [Clostridia bacterium]|nr:ATP-binding protein [Clostridia bacterium]
MVFARERYLQQLQSREHNGLIKVITGMRRSGKSYLMNVLFFAELIKKGIPERQIIRFAFDADEDIDQLDPFFPNEPTRIRTGRNETVINAKKFRAFIKERTNEAEPFYLLLDEVQMLEGFTGTLNGFLRNQNYDVYVTGSNSRFLSSDIATEFKGRGSVLHVLPLTFREYCEGLQLPARQAWPDYLETGGLPLVALMKTREERMYYLKNLCEETYLKDIIEHHRIRKTAELGETLDVIASSIGSPVNVLKLTNTFKTVTKKSITDDTVSSFIDCFEDAFLISKALRYDVRGRKYIGALCKLYFEDVGVRNARLNFRQMEESHLMENILYNELRFRGYNVDVGEVSVREKTERRDRNGKDIYAQKALEVDFVATSGSRKYYIQSALHMPDEQKEAQEKKSLYHIDDSFTKIIVTKNGMHTWTDERGVIVTDLFHFLLGDKDTDDMEKTWKSEP